MPLRYNDIFHPNHSFQRSVNLEMDGGNLAFVEGFIPTKASVTVLSRYLDCILHPGADRASILIGPYGKGKSHTLFLVLTMLSDVSSRADTAFQRLAELIEDIDHATAEKVRKVRSDRIRMLPVVINDRYLDISQAFLASIKQALAQAGLEDLMQDNYYDACLETIKRWKADYPDTYAAYEAYLKAQGITHRAFQTKLKQCDPQALAMFQVCHRKILSGAEFNPLLESDVPTLYDRVSKALAEDGMYSGIFIVFDEFGKYLESAMRLPEALEFKMLQDLSELCGRSTTPRMILTCVTHKAIGEYASHLNTVQQSSFKTIEGRFASIYFTSTFEGSFSLIAGALGRDRGKCAQFLKDHSAARERTVDECRTLNCFSGYESSVEEIVYQCFPMHPLTTLALMKLSERAAQNERTLFTFLADPSSPLNGFIRGNEGAYELAPVDQVYDYFHMAIREGSYDDDLREQVVFADALITTLSADEAKLVRAVVLFDMLMDNCLMATKPVLCAALQWTEERYDSVVSHLEWEHRVYTRRSDGVLCLMRSATETVRAEIWNEINARRGRIDIADQLSELHDPGYTIPRRYNDTYEIVRYFKNVIVSANNFAKQPSARFLSDKGFADGYVVYLLGGLSPNEVQAKLNEWNARNVVVLLPKIPFTSAEVVEECAAISRLLGKEQDEVAFEELSYYFEDILQVVNRCFADLFDSETTCVSYSRVVSCKAITGEISRICEEELYPATPRINHEMMNRSAISGQMRQARINIINAVLSQEDPAGGFAPKSAEAAVIRAVLCHKEDAANLTVMEIVRAFLAECEHGEQPLSRLYQQLMAPPYGMRKGILPIVLAYALKEQLSRVTLYNRRQEQPIDGESLSLLDEYAEEISLRVDRGSAEQLAYLRRLHNAYTPEDAEPNVRHIFDAMNKRVCSLPRCARANRKTLVRDSAGEYLLRDLSKSADQLRKLLLRVEPNARDAVLDKLPGVFGSSPNEACAEKIIDAMDELQRYTPELQRELGLVVRSKFEASEKNSLHGAMVAWMQKQPASALERAYDASTSAMINVLCCGDNHTETEWLDMIAVAIINLPVEDWGDRQIEEFIKQLEQAIRNVEQAPREETETSDDAHIHISLNGRTIRHKLTIEEMDGMAMVVYDSLRSGLEEFGDALSAEEKLLVLTNLMLRLNDKE